MVRQSIFADTCAVVGSAAAGVRYIHPPPCGPSGRNRMLRQSLFVLMGLTIAGCASMQNTPAQDAVWAAYNQCRFEGRVPANVQLMRVEPDGRAWYQTYTSSYGGADFEGCIREKIGASAATKETTTPAHVPTAMPPANCPGNTFWNGVGC